ncbi:MAG: carboxypeptidase regulatory-like domain-containing protein [Acidobacteria bacterium]|nr:carboxypeptidase regulatory-like domain-containing protein [Acidobacteriota bacterium]MBI3282216.1 carboxypeptidase regulatory-like domain-containing protein [Acidobacteriota bacterium]
MKFFRPLGALGTLAFFFGSAMAQEYRGAIRGRVADPSGASVAGATVTAVNQATQVASTTTTARDGAYLLPFLIRRT